MLFNLLVSTKLVSMGRSPVLEAGNTLEMENAQ